MQSNTSSRPGSAGTMGPGAALYTRGMLSVYDLWVLKLSNRLAWRCPSRRLVEHYDEHVSSWHLDLGVGTGYFLDKCRFPSNSPTIALLDLNPNSLEAAARRIARYRPTLFLRDVLQPLDLGDNRFDSAGLNYLLHCLPGAMPSKAKAVFGNLRPFLNDGAVVFGATILAKGIPNNRLARTLLAAYNRQKTMPNADDDLAGLEAALNDRFHSYSTHVVGSVAFFSGQC